MKQKNQITISELSKILNLSETAVRTHLCRFDKYRIPYLRPITYVYNYDFLLKLREFYNEKVENINKKTICYEDVVARLNKIIRLWEKINRVNY